MTYDQLIIFLSGNPWITAACALVTLWPVVRGLFKIWTKVFEWAVNRLARDSIDVQLSTESSSYFIALIFTYAVYFAGCYVIRDITHNLTPLIDESTTIGVIAEALLTLLGMLVSMLGGMLIGSILAVSTLVRRRLRSQSEEQDK